MTDAEIIEKYHKLDREGRIMVERALIEELRRMAVEYPTRPVRPTKMQGTIIHIQKWSGCNYGK